MVIHCWLAMTIIPTNILSLFPFPPAPMQCSRVSWKERRPRYLFSFVKLSLSPHYRHSPIHHVETLLVIFGTKRAMLISRNNCGTRRKSLIFLLACIWRQKVSRPFHSFGVQNSALIPEFLQSFVWGSHVMQLTSENSWVQYSNHSDSGPRDWGISEVSLSIVLTSWHPQNKQSKHQQQQQKTKLRKSIDSELDNFGWMIKYLLLKILSWETCEELALVLWRVKVDVSRGELLPWFSRLLFLVCCSL